MTTPEAFLPTFPPPVRALAQGLRALLAREAPRAVEAVRRGWGGLTYRDPCVGYCAGIFLLAEGVRFGFEWGVLLPDPQGLLRAGTRGSARRFGTGRPGAAPGG
ncbi:MAG: DUF1801 domain-containing protein [Chloroflexota bacterium]